MKTAIFDLDGTISDPSEGIAGAVNYSLTMLGYDEIPPGELLRFIGPPLSEIYGELLPDAAGEGIALFRKYYRETGFARNLLYPGMRDILESLSAAGVNLCIATGKKTDTALAVLDHFDLAGLFETVLGCGDGGRKEDLIRTILSRFGLNAVMIGDRGIDFDAAASAGIPSIGVRWGFGAREELDLASAVAGSPRELPGIMEKLLEE